MAAGHPDTFIPGDRHHHHRGPGYVERELRQFLVGETLTWPKMEDYLLNQLKKDESYVKRFKPGVEKVIATAAGPAADYGGGQMGYGSVTVRFRHRAYNNNQATSMEYIIPFQASDMSCDFDRMHEHFKHWESVQTAVLGPEISHMNYGHALSKVISYQKWFINRQHDRYNAIRAAQQPAPYPPPAAVIDLTGDDDDY